MTNRQRISSTVATALRMLKLLAEHPEGIGVTECARDLGIGKSSAHMLVSTLVQQGFAVRNDESRYQLGISAFEVGSAVPDVAMLGGELLVPMRKLADDSGEAVSLAVRREREAIIVQRFETKHVLRADIRVGTRMELTSCASGKVFLSAMSDTEVDALYPGEKLPGVTQNSVRSKASLKKILAQVRKQRYAVVEGEYAEGITGVAAGVSDATGSVVAVLSLAGPSTRIRIDDWVGPLLTASTAMGAWLASSGPVPSRPSNTTFTGKGQGDPARSVDVARVDSNRGYTAASATS